MHCYTPWSPSASPAAAAAPCVDEDAWGTLTEWRVVHTQECNTNRWMNLCLWHLITKYLISAITAGLTYATYVYCTDLEKVAPRWSHSWLHNIRLHLSRDNLKHFYLPNPSHQFNFSPCNLCTVSPARSYCNLCHVNLYVLLLLLLLLQE